MLYPDEPTTTTPLLQLHLALASLACIAAFAAYYSCAEHRTNPEFAGQLHCLSGMILCNRPLFGTLLCGLAGATLAALLRPADACGAALLLGMYWALLVVVLYDVRAHTAVHFGALVVEIVCATAYVATAAAVDESVLLAYYAVTGAFALVMLANFACLQWAPPFMTVQALAEIAWVGALWGCLGSAVVNGGGGSGR